MHFILDLVRLHGLMNDGTIQGVHGDSYFGDSGSRLRLDPPQIRDMMGRELVDVGNKVALVICNELLEIGDGYPPETP